MLAILNLIKVILRILYRIFINPCYECKRENKCELFVRNDYRFCGDRGFSFYEREDGKIF